MLHIEFKNEQLVLHPLKAIFWPKKSLLFLSDLHLGKAAHFRKSGIAVPAQVKDKNWTNLLTLIQDFQPQTMLFLGDLFHSTYNPVWEELGTLIAEFPSVSFELVPGNHDILSDDQYAQLDLKIHPTTLEIPPFICSHHPMTVDTALYNLAGHIHPSVRLQGPARQRIKLPCFYFGATGAILPAFGSFTGTAIVRPKPGDQVFVIMENEVVQVS